MPSEDGDTSTAASINEAPDPALVPSVVRWKAFWKNTGMYFCGPLMDEKNDQDDQSARFAAKWEAITSIRVFFWVIFTGCILIEPILVGKEPRGINYVLQIIFHCVNTFLYFVLLFSHAEQYPDKVERKFADWNPPSQVGSYIMRVFCSFLTKLDYIIDFVCLTNGWIFLFERPGVAAMRCFRVLRLLWLHRFPTVKHSAEIIVEFIVAKTGFNSMRDVLRYGFNAMEFAELSIRALMCEIFFLSKDTRGGFLLMSLLFYTAYIMGAVMWQEFPGGAPEDNAPCSTLAQCHYTMLRLTLFDGTGFDYAFSLAPTHRYLFFLTMVYMCVTSFGIINGLLGVFSKSFSTASSQAFHKKKADIDLGALGDDTILSPRSSLPFDSSFMEAEIESYRAPWGRQESYNTDEGENVQILEKRLKLYVAEKLLSQTQQNNAMLEALLHSQTQQNNAMLEALLTHIDEENTKQNKTVMKAIALLDTEMRRMQFDIQQYAAGQVSVSSPSEGGQGIEKQKSWNTSFSFLNPGGP